jgi:hypothetical protein
MQPAPNPTTKNGGALEPIVGQDHVIGVGDVLCFAVAHGPPF